MEKIKITKEQEDLLNGIINGGSVKLRSSFIESLLIVDEEFVGRLKPLSDISPEDFTKIACGWYEVEQPFKVGDWVCDSLSGNYAKIVNLHDGDMKFPVTTNFNTNYWVHSDYIEKVTEPWEIMLLDLGREKPELRKGDMYIDDRGDNWTIDSEQFLEEYALPDFESGRVKILFPIERGIEIK